MVYINILWINSSLWSTRNVHPHKEERLWKWYKHWFIRRVKCANMVVSITSCMRRAEHLKNFTPKVNDKHTISQPSLPFEYIHIIWPIFNSTDNLIIHMFDILYVWQSYPKILLIKIWWIAIRDNWILYVL